MSNLIIKLTNSKHYYLKIFLDGMLLFAAFLTAYFFKRGSVSIEPAYLSFLPLLFVCWLVSFLPTNKFRGKKIEDNKLHLEAYFVSGCIFAGLLSLSLYFLKWYALSRLIVFGSISIWLLGEVIIMSWIYNKLKYQDKEEKLQDKEEKLQDKEEKLQDKEEKLQDSIPFYFFILEGVLLLASFMGAHYLKKGSFSLEREYEMLLFVLCFSWLFGGTIVHKFTISKSNRYIRVIWPFIKSAFVLVCAISFFVFASRMEQFPRLMVFGSLAVFFILDVLMVSFYYFYISPKKTDELEVNLFKVDIIKEQEIIKTVVDNNQIKERHSAPGEKYQSKLFKKKLKDIYLKKIPLVYEFVDKVTDIASIDILSAEVINSSNLYNIETLPDNSLDLFINLHELNNFRRVNEYLINVNHKIKDDGVFIGKFEPKENRRTRFLKKYPLNLANIMYFLDFVWKRCFPKLPVLQKIYFALSKGKNRVLSLTEGLGRITFCGFEIISMQEINNFVFFAAKKTGAPADDPNPSYSPVFKMKRVGRYGNPIYVYKFRTMYPYSEYLQAFVTKQIGYGDKGKVENDFRVTKWGRFLRRFWLDELPQLINFFKGELSLVSVRPLSEGFLSNYPEDLKKERLKYKPGCFPPYVAYKMQAVDQYLESERIYLAEKQKHPIWTDVKVLFVGLYNIATNKIRSE